MEQVDIDTNVKAVITAMEEQASDSWVGPARAYFEIPVGDDFVRGVYRTYVVQAPTLNEALSGLQACIEQQITAASTRSMTTNLVWRLPNKVEVELTENHGWVARTRLVVLPEEKM